MFEAAVSKVAVFGGLLEDLTRRVFEIEGELPVSMFSGSPHLSEDELDELEALINKQDATGESV